MLGALPRLTRNRRFLDPPQAKCAWFRPPLHKSIAYVGHLRPFFPEFGMKWISYIVLYGGTVPKATHFQPKRSVFHAQTFDSLDTPCRSAAFTYCLLSAAARRAKANDKPAFSQSGTQGVSMTWTIENLYFDGRLLALDVLVSPSDTRYSACNDVLCDYATSRKPTTLVRKVLFRLAFTVKLIFGQIRFQKRVPSSVQGNAKAVKPFADSVGCSHPKKPRKSARFIWIAASWKRPDS